MRLKCWLFWQHWGFFSLFFHERLIMKSDSSNAMSWINHDGCKPWKLCFIFNEIRSLTSRLWVVFHHELRSPNKPVDSLTKRGWKNCSLGNAFVTFTHLGICLLYPNVVVVFSFLSNNISLFPVKKKTKREKYKNLLLILIESTHWLIVSYRARFKVFYWSKTTHFRFILFFLYYFSNELGINFFKSTSLSTNNPNLQGKIQ